MLLVGRRKYALLIGLVGIVTVAGSVVLAKEYRPAIERMLSEMTPEQQTLFKRAYEKNPKRAVAKLKKEFRKKKATEGVQPENAKAKRVFNALPPRQQEKIKKAIRKNPERARKKLKQAAKRLRHAKAHDQVRRQREVRKHMRSNRRAARIGRR